MNKTAKRQNKAERHSKKKPPQIGAVLDDCDRYVMAEVLRMALKSWLGNPAPGLPQIRGTFGQEIDPTEAADRVREVVIKMDGCDPDCRGWIHANGTNDPIGYYHKIQRCDECDVFESDNEAEAVHDRECDCKKQR